MQTLFNILVRLVLLVAGLVFAASLLVAIVLMVVAWSLRYAWARLTGQPVSPFVVHIDARDGFNRMYRRPGQGAPPPAEPTRTGRRELADVTDVEPKEPRA